MELSRYNILWTNQSKDSGESMPLGGHDVGCNVWVEKEELFLYLAQSGAFDDHGNMLKAGRLRFSFSRNLFADGFRQELRLEQGDIRIQSNSAHIHLWADMFRSAVHIEIATKEPVSIQCAYENWRLEDTVEARNGEILFFHRNPTSALLDERLGEQGIEYLKPYFPDVEKNRTIGGLLSAPGMLYSGKGNGKYMNHAFVSYIQKTAEPTVSQTVDILLQCSQTETENEWIDALRKKKAETDADFGAEEKTKEWWRSFWKRSYIYIKPDTGTPQDEDWQVGRNIQLFRYMLAANAYGEFPTKFNGGLFTVDAESFVPGHKGSPDWRDWGGIMFTAQNQRYVYWGMIKNGDFDMMKPAFEFYRRLVEPIKRRTEHFFGLKDCACYCEQIDANGLSGYYGKYGVDYPLQVRHHYVEALEFAFMILKYRETCYGDITDYMPFILSVLNFYDRYYPKLDERGKRIIFPSTAMETYHGAPLIWIYGKEGVEAANYSDEETAVTNPADVIAALHDTITLLLDLNLLSKKDSERFEKLRNELPPIPTEIKKGHKVVAPCEFPKKYYKGNCEIPQLNTVYPYHIYGIGRPNLQLARDTYDYAWDEEDQLSHVSWQNNNICAARIGNIPEAVRYMRLKLHDSGRKFPAYWGPGQDYTPDHNWGGCGLVGLQEMLMQNFDGKIYLLPAWDIHTDVCFKLWADRLTVVECQLKSGKLTVHTEPESRMADIILPSGLE